MEQQKFADQYKRLFFPPLPRFLLEQPFGLMALGNERQAPHACVTKRMQLKILSFDLISSKGHLL